MGLNFEQSVRVFFVNVGSSIGVKLTSNKRGVLLRGNLKSFFPLIKSMFLLAIQQVFQKPGTRMGAKYKQIVTPPCLLERTLVIKLFEYTCNCSLVRWHISWINKLLVSIVDNYLYSTNIPSFVTIDHRKYL